MKLKQSNKVEGIGLPQFKRPEYAATLRFPTDITELTAENITDLIGKYTALLCYAQGYLSGIVVSILDTEQRLSLTESKILIDEPRYIHLEKWKRDSLVKTDSRIRHLNYELSNNRKAKEIAEAFVANYERCIAALSKELTRKMSQESPSVSKFTSKL